MRELLRSASGKGAEREMHIVVSGWFWDQPSTGSGQYLRRLLPHLLAAGPDVAEKAAKQPVNGESAPRYTLLLPVGSSQLRTPSSASKSPQLEIAVAAPPARLPGQLAKLYWEQVTVPRAARRLRADVLFVPYWAAPLWQPMPTAVTVHDLIPLLLPAYRSSWLGRLYTWLVSLTARRCAAVLAVSEAGKRDIMAHLGLPAERVFAVHHGPNVESGSDAGREAAGAAPADGPGSGKETAANLSSSLTDAKAQRAVRPMLNARRAAVSIGQTAKGCGQHWSQSQVAQKYALPERYFLYLGGFDARKNVLGIVCAYHRYLEQGGDAAVQLVVGGRLPPVDSAFFPDPQRLVRELGLTERVRFIGWVDEADKAPLYAGATAYLFPSSYEGFGMMALEAMAAGTPVITSSH